MKYAVKCPIDPNEKWHSFLDYLRGCAIEEIEEPCLTGKYYTTVDGYIVALEPEELKGILYIDIDTWYVFHESVLA